MKTKSLKPYLIVLIVIGVSIACTFSYSSDQNAPPPNEPDSQEDGDSPPSDAEEGGELDCQEDMDCFIQAAQECQPSQVTYVFPLDFMGVLITTTSALSIEGFDADQCVFTIKTEQVEAAYSEATLQQLKDNGMSDDEIEAQRQMIEDQSIEAGYDDTCRGNGDDLALMLTNWQAGSISTEDWLPFTCEGKIFSAMSVEPEATQPPAATPTAEQAGDGNLLLNPSFEGDPQTTETLWQVETRSTNLAAHWTTDNPKLGTYAMHLSASASGNQGWPGWFVTNPILIEPGVQYIFRTWAYTPDGADAWVSIELLDDSGQKIKAISLGCVDIETGVWSSVYVSLLPEDSEGFSAIRLGMQQCLSNTDGTVTNLYYDDVYFGPLVP